MQHINLYSPDLRKQESNFGARNVALAAAAMFVGLLIVSGIDAIRLSTQNNALLTVENNLHEVKQQVNKLTQTLPKMIRNDSLPDKLKKLERETKQKQAVLAVLSERSLGNVDGFVEHLAGFARQHVNGLWLTNVRLEQGGTQLSLAGHALKPEYVPQYLKKLANEPVLQGTEFKSFLLVNEKQSKRKVDFQITTQAAVSATTIN